MTLEAQNRCPGPVAVSRNGQPRPRAHCLRNSPYSAALEGRSFGGRAIALEIRSQENEKQLQSSTGIFANSESMSPEFEPRRIRLRF